MFHSVISSISRDVTYYFYTEVSVEVDPKKSTQAKSTALDNKKV